MVRSVTVVGAAVFVQVIYLSGVQKLKPVLPMEIAIQLKCVKQMSIVLIIMHVQLIHVIMVFVNMLLLNV